MSKACLRFVLGMVCVCGLVEAGASAADSQPLPPNIVVGSALHAITAHMLKRSPTFRAQVFDLGSTRLVRIRVVLDLSLVGSMHQPTCRADASLRKYQFGRIDALVRLRSRDDAPELIAHELEHVREFVEGVDFRVLAARLHSGVWYARSGHYETARAVATGKRVAQEVKQGAIAH